MKAQIGGGPGGKKGGGPSGKKGGGLGGKKGGGPGKKGGKGRGRRKGNKSSNTKRIDDRKEREINKNKFVSKELLLEQMMAGQKTDLKKKRKSCG